MCQNPHEIITYKDAVAMYGREMIEAIMPHDRHHHDESGRPYWLAEELAEAAELVQIERSREEGSHE
jgi:hypothetical protein